MTEETTDPLIQLTRREYEIIMELARTGEREHGAWDPDQRHLGLKATAVGLNYILPLIEDRNPVLQTPPAWCHR